MYKIKLQNFEGPFDLLLYFIKRDEINIYDIPIARITEEYLRYIKVMQHFDLELAGEFILMAATLMYIKAQMLLPRPSISAGDDEESDPRTELVERLLEYKQIKEAALGLGELAEENRYNYYRHVFDVEEPIISQSIGFKNTTLFDLIKAFKGALERAKPIEETKHNVQVYSETVEDRKSYILNQLARCSRLKFDDLIESYTRPKIVVTFLALLELMRLNRIFVQQDETFSEIFVILKPGLN
jgi:segregation and condensation protein A